MHPNSPVAATAQVKLGIFLVIDVPILYRWIEVQFCQRRVTTPMTQANLILAALSDEPFPHILEWPISKGDCHRIQLHQELPPAVLHPIPSITGDAALAAHKAAPMTRDQRLPDALLEMRALARISPKANGLTSYSLGFLSPRIHSTSHPNKE